MICPPSSCTKILLKMCVCEIHHTRTCIFITMDLFLSVSRRDTIPEHLGTSFLVLLIPAPEEGCDLGLYFIFFGPSILPLPLLGGRLGQWKPCGLWRQRNRGLDLGFILCKTQMSCLQNGCWRIRDDSGKPLSTVPAIEILALHFLDLRVGRVNPYAQSVKTSTFITQPLDVY